MHPDHDQTQLSGDYTIDDSGMVDLLLLGLVGATGQTADGPAVEITTALQAKKLILAPSVAVEVSHHRPLYIPFVIATPAQYPYLPRMTALTAISIAGGFTDRALQDYIGVTRDSGSGPVQYRAPLFALAEPGDVITVFARRF